MDNTKFSIAVSSKVALQEVGSLEQPTRRLGELLAANNYMLLSPINYSLSYAVAKATHDKSGLSIGFSPATNLRYHIVSQGLPTDVYDWIFFAQCQDTELLNMMIGQSQALILVGGVLDNIAELTQALARFLPVAILVDDVNHQNNDLLRYLNGLPVEKQRQIVLHHDPQILLEAFGKILNKAYEDLSDKIKKDNNKLFQKLMKEN